MSKWCGNENCLQCVDKEPDPYVHLPREDYEALRAENARLWRGLENCHMLARRIVASESAFLKIDSANHIIRMCEEAGVTSVKGVLRDAALQPKEAQP